MFHVIEDNRVTVGPMASTSEEDNNGLFIFMRSVRYELRCIVSQGAGWEHVSVSRSDRKMPT